MEDGYAYRRYQVMNLVQAAWSAAGRPISNLIQPQVIAAGDATTNGNHNDDFDHEFAGIDLTLDTNGYYTTGTGSGCAGTCLPIVTNWSVSPYRPVDVNIDTLSYASYFGGLLYNWGACNHFGGTIPAVYAGWIASDNYATGVATNNPTSVNSQHSGSITIFADRRHATVLFSTRVSLARRSMLIQSIQALAPAVLPMPPAIIIYPARASRQEPTSLPMALRAARQPGREVWVAIRSTKTLQLPFHQRRCH